VCFQFPAEGETFCYDVYHVPRISRRILAAKNQTEVFVLPPGLSPDLQSMEQIRRVMRPTDVPDQGLLCDLLWADPDKDVLGWGENDRGVSFTFGADVVAKFLHKHDMDLICRAHQVMFSQLRLWDESWCTVIHIKLQFNI